MRIIYFIYIDALHNHVILSIYVAYNNLDPEFDILYPKRPVNVIFSKLSDYLSL